MKCASVHAALGQCIASPHRMGDHWNENGSWPSVLGFLAQCSICPQQALIADQPAGEWTCPRCTEVAGGFGDIDVAHAEPVDSLYGLDPHAAISEITNDHQCIVLCRCGNRCIAADQETARYVHCQHRERAQVAAERPDERQNRIIVNAIDTTANWGADEWWLNKVRG